MDGNWTEAAATFEKTLEIANTSRTVLWAQSYTMADLAEAYLALGRGADALETATRALAEAKRLRSKGCEGHTRLALARVRLGLEGASAGAAVEALLGEAEAHMQELGLCVYLPHVALARAELARVRGLERARLAALHEAERLFAEIGAAGHLRSVRRTLAAIDSRLDAQVPA